ncbi:hypothetical protein ACQ4M4_13225 [Leptolyngbya sp. AN02str]|uniref:hypothetical protein n=1 Tax=Leptolyngbya sp. AN02str TaxID=3423363 RepID=UPI003D31B9A6
MGTKIINSTFSAIQHEVAVVLESYPHHPYQQAFSIPTLRQELMTYVMNHLPGHYQVVDDTQSDVMDWHQDTMLAKHQDDMDNIIHQGIEQILQNHSAWVEHHIPASMSAGVLSSTWFG